MEWSQLVWYLLTALFSIYAGFLLGSRRARKVKKRVVQQLNIQSLELLDVKAERNQLKTYTQQHHRKDRLLKLTLTRLQQANSTIKALVRQQELSDKRHFIEHSHMRMCAVQARETARKAVALAKRTGLHLQRLEKASPVMQTIEAPEPKSYGKSDPVTVSVVDQALLDGTAPSISQVSNRDSARLTKLHSSNEAKAN